MPEILGELVFGTSLGPMRGPIKKNQKTLGNRAVDTLSFRGGSQGDYKNAYTNKGSTHVRFERDFSLQSSCGDGGIRTINPTILGRGLDP